MTAPLILDVVPAVWDHVAHQADPEGKEHYAPPTKWKRPCPEPRCRGGEVQYPEWEGRTETCELCDGEGTITTPLPSIIDWQSCSCACHKVAPAQSVHCATCRTVRVSVEAVPIISFRDCTDEGHHVCVVDWNMPDALYHRPLGGSDEQRNETEWEVALPDTAKVGEFAIVGRPE